MKLMEQGRRIVIIGGGFGGLACANELGGVAGIDVTIVDRRNHNLFQPLLYQVATAALSPADIAEPIRKTLGRFDNITMLMGEVVGIEPHQYRIVLEDGSGVEFEELVIATGSDYNYFGHDDWRVHAPGLKTLHEARQIRQKLLVAFEKAERAADPQQKKSLLTSVVIGGGPTGVEMAGAISELGRFMISRDFRNLDPQQMRVLLVEAGPRLLAAFPEHLSSYAHDYLTRIGVEVLTSTRVSNITSEGVEIDASFVQAGCVVWGAGVKASPVANWLGIEGYPGGRIPVDGYLRVKGMKNIYALGDTSLFTGTDGKPLPGLAQVAKQQGIYLGRVLRHPAGERNAEFRFRNRGNTAVIGRNAAVFDFGKWTLKGRVAWFLWAIVHVYLLVNFEKRVLVSVQWIWRYLTRQRGARLIDELPPETSLGQEPDKSGDSSSPVCDGSEADGPPRADGAVHRAENSTDATIQPVKGDETGPGAAQSAEGICPECGGSGEVNQSSCPTCAGRGTITVIVGDA